MDACLWVVVGSFIIQQVTALSCTECTHIVWNPTDLKSKIQPFGDQDQEVKTSWVATVNNILLVNVRFNPDCSAKYPVRFSKNESMYTVDPTLSSLGTFVNQECPGKSEEGRCEYIHGNVEVKLVNLKTHAKYIKLDVHVRKCGQSKPSWKEGKDCVKINSTENSGHDDIKTYFNDALSFLGDGTALTYFVVEQCLCTSSPCPRQPTPTPAPTTVYPASGTDKLGIGLGIEVLGLICTVAFIIMY